MSAIRWSNSSPGGTFSYSQSGKVVTLVNTGGWARVYDDSVPVKTGNFTIYVTINGSRTSTTVSPYENNARFADLFDISEQSTPFSFSITIPDNLLGQTVSISFSARKNISGGEYIDQDSSSNPCVSISVSTFVPVNPSISWDSGTSLSAVDNGDGTLTATLSGGATIGGGATGTVYYRVWCETTRKNNDGSTAKTWTFEPTAYDIAVTIKVQAYFTYNGTTYTTSSDKTCTVTVDSGNYVNYYDGTDWVQCKVFYYDGIDWIECKPYYYNGSGWVEISS